jgi:hypothetical protein
MPIILPEFYDLCFSNIASDRKLVELFLHSNRMIGGEALPPALAKDFLFFCLHPYLYGILLVAKHRYRSFFSVVATGVLVAIAICYLLRKRL